MGATFIKQVSDPTGPEGASGPGVSKQWPADHLQPRSDFVQPSTAI